MNLCKPSSLKSVTARFTPVRVGGCRLTMALPRNEQGPQRFRSVPLFDNLHLENSFEDNGVGGQQVLDLLALEDDVFHQCLSAQPDPTVLQRSNSGKCAHLLCDFDAAADMPPHCPLFGLQLLDLTHRWWSESEGPDIEEGRMSTPLRQRPFLALNCTPPGFQTLGSRLALSLTLLTSCRYSEQAPTSQRATSLYTAQAVHEVVVEEYRILDSVNCEQRLTTGQTWSRLSSSTAFP